MVDRRGNRCKRPYKDEFSRQGRNNIGGHHRNGRCRGVQTSAQIVAQVERSL